MDKWEYRFLFLTPFTSRYKLEARLNELGKQGWELVFVNNPILYFKRKVQS
ncbi:MAG: hypothetical protein FWC27_07500 [Firmicutes bacterium]|nr:hypothetical protein [Bacillota bacterium]